MYLFEFGLESEIRAVLTLFKTKCLECQTRISQLYTMFVVKEHLMSTESIAVFYNSIEPLSKGSDTVETNEANIRVWIISYVALWNGLSPVTEVV